MGKILNRKDFDALKSFERRAFISGGGGVVDAPPAPGLPIRDPDLLTRGEFMALSPADRLAAVRAGRKIVDGVRAAQE